jgi:3-dehydroquinate dehydratase/shikimate dehydrogenase
MICVPIVGPSIDLARDQLERATRSADLAEIRLDLIDQSNFEEMLRLVEGGPVPLVLTMRHISHGGKYEGVGVERVRLFQRLLSFSPDYLDIEADAEDVQKAVLKEKSRRTKVVYSYHNFDETPSDLEAIYEEIKAKGPDIIKMACSARSSLDTLRMMQLVKSKAKEGQRVIGLCMGEKGLPTRTLSPLFGNAWTFASLDEHTMSVANQSRLKDLLEIYRYRKLNVHSKLCALIGSPVDKSVGHIFHNRAFQNQHLNAVYEKIHVTAGELGEFFEYARKFPFQGLSVTMPLKESVMPYLDFIDHRALSIGAVNTIRFREGKLYGYNTDGVGALDAIEERLSVAGKKMLLIGAGGAAKAIAEEAVSRGAELCILNRDQNKAKALAEKYDCRHATIQQQKEILREGVDILINSTSLGMSPKIKETPVEAADLHHSTLVMDIISNPKETKLLREAKLAGCQVISGMEMFENQAKAQLKLFFK